MFAAKKLEVTYLLLRKERISCEIYIYICMYIFGAQVHTYIAPVHEGRGSISNIHHRILTHSPGNIHIQIGLGYCKFN